MRAGGESGRGDVWAHLRLFSAALDGGQTQAALEAARDACLADPQFPEAHYAFGQAWMAAARPERAEECFAVAIKLRPGFADAWVNLGLARYNQGDVDQAKTCFSRALQAAPGHAAANANLAALLRLTGSYDTSETLLRQGLMRNPYDNAARLNLVAICLHEERHAEALALLDGVAPPKDDIPCARHWHLQRVTTLIALGRIADARKALADCDALGPAPPEVKPLRIWRDLLLAMSDRRIDEARALAETMAAATDDMGPGALLEHRIMAHYELARFWSGAGEDKKAFACWAAGHSLLRASQPFSRDATRQYNDAALSTFTAERYASGPRARNDDPAPVFIVGMPRSGTTLAEQILAAHAHVHGAGERPDLRKLAWRLGGGDETAAAIARTAALDAAALDAEADTYLKDLRALAPGKSRIVDKMPGNYAQVWLIGLLFPKAKIIHCVRDPRDIGLSIFTFRFYGEHGYAHDLGDLGWSIGEQHRIMSHWKTRLPVLTLRLDDWVRDFDGTLANVLAFLDLPPDPACARFHERQSHVKTVSREQVRQPINARGLGRWKPFAAELQPLIEELERAGALEGWRDAAPAARTSGEKGMAT